MQHDINRFCAPQNITKDALLVISALYSLVTDTGIELSCRVISWRENRLTLRPLHVIIFSTKILSEDPYLKSFIRRLLCLHRERFCSL